MAALRRKIDKNLGCANTSYSTMTSNYFIISIKLNLDVGKYISMSNFGGRIMNGFKVIEAGPEPHLNPISGAVSIG